MSAHSCISLYLSSHLPLRPWQHEEGAGLDGGRPGNSVGELWLALNGRRQCLRPPITHNVFTLDGIMDAEALWEPQPGLRWRLYRHLRRMKCPRWKLEKSGWFWFCGFAFDHLDTTSRCEESVCVKISSSERSQCAETENPTISGIFHSRVSLKCADTDTRGVSDDVLALLNFSFVIKRPQTTRAVAWAHWIIPELLRVNTD